jgi:hypothetical protein
MFQAIRVLLPTAAALCLSVASGGIDRNSNKFMQMKFTITIFISLSLLSCKERAYVVEHNDNNVYKPNIAFIAYEDISLPRFDSLKTKYQLDTLFHGETDEFKRILLLRNWIRQHIPINDFGDPYPGNDHPQGIIDAAAQGQGFHCGHYMVVQNALMNAYGYVTRCLGSGPGIKGGADGHHGMNEIWLNSKRKWFLSDAKFNHHFEKDGVPLSALELRDEFLKNRAADVQVVKGPDRTPITVDSLKDARGTYRKRDKQWFAQWYTWLEWDKTSTRFSSWPRFDTKLNMYKDDYFAANTWYWDGKPHWAYNTDAITYQDLRDAIEWTPNTVHADVKVDKNIATIKLSSFTPNIKAYQVKQGSEWARIDSVTSFKLRKNREELVFRAVNTANVAGPENRIIFTSK